MRLTKIKLYISVAILLFLSACNLQSAMDPTAIAAEVLTSVAQTIEAMPTATQEPTATETATPTPTETPTETPSPMPSPTSGFTATPGNLGSGNPTQAQCDNAVFVSDVTVPDGTQFAPGTAFTKTWRLRNTGTCTWNAEYAVKFLNGDKMSGTSPTKLTASSVAPGAEVDITVSLVAPAQVGTYTGYWQLQNANNAAFGQTFFVQIKVATGIATITPTPTATSSAAPTFTATPSPTLGPTATETPTPTETATSTP